MQKNDIKNIVSAGEGQTVEFKSTFDKKSIETLTAFANSNGGTVLVGVEDNGKLNLNAVRVDLESVSPDQITE